MKPHLLYLQHFSFYAPKSFMKIIDKFVNFKNEDQS